MKLVCCEALRRCGRVRYWRRLPSRLTTDAGRSIGCGRCKGPVRVLAARDWAQLSAELCDWARDLGLTGEEARELELELMARAQRALERWRERAAVIERVREDVAGEPWFYRLQATRKALDKLRRERRGPDRGRWIRREREARRALERWRDRHDGAPYTTGLRLPQHRAQL